MGHDRADLSFVRSGDGLLGPPGSVHEHQHAVHCGGSERCDGQDFVPEFQERIRYWCACCVRTAHCTATLCEFGYLGLHLLCVSGWHGTSHVENAMYGKSASAESSSFSTRMSKAVHLYLTISETDGHVAVTLQPAATSARMRGHVSGDHSYLELLFDEDQVCVGCWTLSALWCFSKMSLSVLTCFPLQLKHLYELPQKGGSYHCRVEIRNPILRSFMLLKQGQESFYDVAVRSGCGRETRRANAWHSGLTWF